MEVLPLCLVLKHRSFYLLTVLVSPIMSGNSQYSILSEILKWVSVLSLWVFSEF